MTEENEQRMERLFHDHYEQMYRFAFALLHDNEEASRSCNRINESLLSYNTIMSFRWRTEDTEATKIEIEEITSSEPPSEEHAAEMANTSGPSSPKSTSRTLI